MSLPSCDLFQSFLKFSPLFKLEVCCPNIVSKHTPHHSAQKVPIMGTPKFGHQPFTMCCHSILLLFPHAGEWRRICRCLRPLFTQNRLQCSSVDFQCLFADSRSLWLLFIFQRYSGIFSELPLIQIHHIYFWKFLVWYFSLYDWWFSCDYLEKQHGATNYKSWAASIRLWFKGQGHLDHLHEKEIDIPIVDRPN